MAVLFELLILLEKQEFIPSLDKEGWRVSAGVV